MSESVRPPVRPDQPAPPPSPRSAAPAPSGDFDAAGATGSTAAASTSAGATGAGGASEESVRRKLLMGAALLLAMTSIYAGVFNVGRVAQIVLAAGATMAVVLALTSGSRRRDS